MAGDKKMKDKRLAINLFSNLLSYASSMIISFLLTPFLVRHLGKEIYGFYGIANNVVNYVSLASIALNSMAAKYITVELVRGNLVKAEQYYTSIFFSNVLLSVFLAPFLALIVIFIQTFFNISDIYLHEVRILFILVFITMILNLVSSVVGSATYAKNRVDLKAYSNIGKSALRICLYMMIFKVFKPSIVYVGIVALLIELYNSGIQLVLKDKLMPELSVCIQYFNKRLVFQTLKVGVWNSLNHLGDLLLSSSDLILANVMISEAASGTISIIKTMPTLLSGVITAINGVFMPRIAIKYGEGNKQHLIQEVKLSQRIMGCISTAVIMMLILFGKEFYDLWVPGNDSDLLMKLSALDVSRMLFVGVTWPIANLNIVMDKIKYPSLLVIASGIANVISMYLLIQYTHLGIFSIPITTLVLSILFYGIFIPMYPCKLLNVSYKTFFSPVVEMVVSSVLICAVLLPIKRFIHISSWTDFVLYCGILGIGCLLITVFTFCKPHNVFLYISRILNNRQSVNNDK